MSRRIRNERKHTSFTGIETCGICRNARTKNIVCNAKYKSFREQIDGLKIRDISADYLVKFKDYPQLPEGERVHQLIPVSGLKLSLSGIACYEKTVYLEAVQERDVLKAEHVFELLKAEHVFELMKAAVNGSKAGVRIFPPHQVEISGEAALFWRAEILTYQGQ